jgi:predicted RecB family nuclease
VLDRGLNGTYPDPVEHCGLCRWSNHCDARREADDHLCLVANMRRSQTARLGEVGITTVAQLARAEPTDWESNTLDPWANVEVWPTSVVGGELLARDLCRPWRYADLGVKFRASCGIGQG